MSDRLLSNRSVWHQNLLKGKVALITGATGFFCRAQVKAFIASGANVAIVGRNEHDILQLYHELVSFRKDCVVFMCPNVDVRDLSSISSAVLQVIKQLGRIDFVISSPAGSFLRDFNHISSNMFNTIVSIDRCGSLNTAKACLEELRKNKGVFIINSASLHPYQVPFSLPVNMAHSGADILCDFLHNEFGSLGICFKCLVPSYNRIYDLSYDKTIFNPPMDMPKDIAIALVNIANSTIMVILYGTYNNHSHINPVYMNPWSPESTYKYNLYPVSLDLGTSARL
ncbi:Piso0_002838 [Millerozyma farinosa CBS 7064]|uniref:2,4-dienoyl-CoA reductase [(3E)-enoyl-CoA-producing] n=1 Tax=Pichia sorbitophila (strain ATCC MYA-4447 / BCRC 22081 / CBS 7064 / NBRC 10061 / NRRL Y-12695) TaxID=559304 RepID=G8YG41_PICSO|nr:Piso0_002838 [Millerozyma farinosa CBS 7064]